MTYTFNTNTLTGSTDYSTTCFNGFYIQEFFNNFGVSAILKNHVNTILNSIYYFDLIKIADIDKIPKVIKYLKVKLKTDLLLIENYEYAFTVVIFNKSDNLITFKYVLDKCDLTSNQAIIGLDIFNNIQVLDFNKQSHLLIAGTTGSGKSVLLNDIICSLLLYSTTSKFYFIDLKKVESTYYKGLFDIVTEQEKAIKLLDSLCDEMEKRYLEMEKRKEKNYSGDHIYVIIDELADLMLSCRYEIEPYLIRLAQKARACNIHLILATQRPQVSVITGLLKANLPNRVCLKCASVRDSMVVIDHKGGESLHGNGDLILKLSNTTEEKRVQAPFIFDDDIDKIVELRKNYERN